MCRCVRSIEHGNGKSKGFYLDVAIIILPVSKIPASFRARRLQDSQVYVCANHIGYRSQMIASSSRLKDCCTCAEVGSATRGADNLIVQVGMPSPPSVRLI